MYFWHVAFVRLPPPHTEYKHIVAVKATIDKQSPHAKLLLKSGFLSLRNELFLFTELNGAIMVDPVT